MKIKAIFMTAAMACFGLSGYAQSGVWGKDSVACVQNLSLLTNFSKQQDKLVEALGYYDAIIADCPGAHVSIYNAGERTLTGLLKIEKDAAKKKEYLDKLMAMYDYRLKYFGNYKKMPRYSILARKASNYMKYAGDGASKEPAYQWLNEAIKAGGTKNEVLTFWNYFDASRDLYKSSPEKYKEQFLNDYLYITPLMIERSNSGDAKDSVFAEVKGEIDMAFGRSGVADCKTLDGIYSSKLEGNKSDKDFLKRVLSLYNMAECEESSVYFKASDYMHRIEPSAGSACGLAVQAMKNKDNNKAINYFKEAIKLSDDRAFKSKVQVSIASIYSKLGNYVESRNYANAALANNHKNSAAYIMIAYLYASNRDKISDDQVIQKTAYWAAVDKLEKAKQVDPDCASQVNKTIASYKQQFPPKQELFMRGISGSSYTVPGWINEKTTVR